MVELEPGVYPLRLEYFEGTNQARLSFMADADAIEWDETTECFGEFWEQPPQRYVVHRSSESAATVSDRYGADLNKVISTSMGTSGVHLVPGLQTAPIKVIVLQGVTTHATPCDETDDFTERLQIMIHAVQLDQWTRQNRVAELDSTDFIPFSYADQYTLCDGGSSSTANLTSLDGVNAKYTPADTCHGVANGAVHLASLIERISSLAPEATIHLVGHSMGGMVAAYLMANPAMRPMHDKVASVVTLDAPLRGEVRQDLKPGNLCTGSLIQATWDISGSSQIVTNISSLRLPSELDRFVEIDSSTIGDALPAMARSRADCFTGGLFSFLDHECVWSDPKALSVLADFIGRDLKPPSHTNTVRVAVRMVSFEEKQSVDDFLFIVNPGDPYYKISVDGQEHITAPTFEGGARVLEGYFPVVFEVSADRQSVSITIQAWDSDSDFPDPVGDEIYDISTSPGSDSNGLSLLVAFDLTGDLVTLSGDGTLDGSSQGPQGAIRVQIETVKDG